MDVRNATYLEVSYTHFNVIPEEPGECVEGPGEGFMLAAGPRGGCVLADM